MSQSYAHLYQMQLQLLFTSTICVYPKFLHNQEIPSQLEMTGQSCNDHGKAEGKRNCSLVGTSSLIFSLVGSKPELSHILAN